VNDFLEFGGNRGVEFAENSSHGVGEDNPPGVEIEPGEFSVLFSSAIAWIPNDGMAGGGEMDADLMGPPRHWLDLNKGKIIEDFTHCIQGQGFTRLLGPNRNPLPVFGVATDGPIDFPLGYLNLALNQTKIDFLHFAGFELPLEFGVSSLAPGDDHDARCLLVQSMDDARPLGVSDLLDAREMVKKSIDQSYLFYPGTRMNRQAGGLVEDNDVLIAINDVEGNVHRPELIRLSFRKLDLNDIAHLKLLGWFGCFSVNRCFLVGDKFLGLGSCQVPDVGRQENIQPTPRTKGARDEKFLLRHFFFFLRSPAAQDPRQSPGRKKIEDRKN